MSYTALYRKFRPDVFDEVKGQDAIVTTLKNQILSGRIGHAYLFCGTRGTGKTSVAKLFARAVNCEHPDGADPCGQCESCLAAARGAASNIMEIDAASNNSVDDIRNIRSEVEYRPAQGRYKVYIIDEAHMLSTGAFNALLKTLEEPPEYVIFILATTEAARLPVTIVSRCQCFDFRRISIDTICERLSDLVGREGLGVEEKGLRYISRLADGSMRDALSLLERCISGMSSDSLSYDEILSILGNVDSNGYLEMLKAVNDRNIYGAVSLLERFSLEGRDMTSFSSGFTWFLRNLLLARNAEGIEDILDVTKEEFALIREQALLMNDEDLMRYIRIFSELTLSLRNSASKRIDVEMALIRLCRPQTEETDPALGARLRDVEKKVEELEKNGVRLSSVPAQIPAAPQKKTEPIKIRKAAPEELVRIRDRWEGIVAGMPGLLKSVLEGSEPQYNSKEPGNTLYVRVRNAVNKDIICGREENLRLISEAAEKEANGSVRIEIICGEDNRSDPDIIKIQSLENIQKKINETIEIAD